MNVVDPFHCNSIDVDKSGNVLVSSRHMDSLFLISKSTGKVMWKMGGTAYSKDGAKWIRVTGDSQDGFYRQHDARFQPDGTISLFDDETAMPGPARAIILSYNVDQGTASIVWQFKSKGPGPVGAMGSFTILPDGSRVIGWGTQAGGGPTFTEVTEKGDDLLDFSFSGGDTSYRALKIPTSEIEIDALRRSIGPWSSSLAPGDAGTSSDSEAQSADEAGATTVCHTLAGTGAMQECAYVSSTAPGFACASVPGAVEGSCPAASLYGCCIHTAAPDGGQSVSATCYYSASTGQAASSQCSFEAYQGMPYRWQTSLP